MKALFCAAAVAGCLVSTPALAQQFGGLRVEGRVGWDNVGVDIDGPGAPVTIDEEASTVSYGAEVGYDLSLGNAIVGAYGGIDFSEAEFCDEVFGNDRACIEGARNITVGGRVGLGVTPEALLYAKAGYSNARVRARYDNFGDLFGEIEDEASRTGYHVGIGAELDIGPVYGKVEYVHTEYDALEIQAGTEGKLSRNQVLAGVGIRF
jgi:outer membrane immunogenic protein